MMRRIKLLLVLLLTTPTLAQVPVIVSATITDSSNNPATGGYVEFDLQPANSSIAYRINGSSVLAPLLSKCAINASGNLVNFITGTGNCNVWGNDIIIPSNTTYNVIIAPNGRVTGRWSNIYIFGGTYNLNSPTQIQPQPVIGTIINGSPLVTQSIVPDIPATRSIGTPQNPYAQVYALGLNVVGASLVGNNTFTGTNIFNGLTIFNNTITAGIINAGSVTGTAFNGPIGTVIPAAGTFTSLTASGLANLSGGGTITGAYAGSPTFSGTPIFSGGAVAKSLNGIPYCDQFSGATADVQITAAIAALPAGGGTIDCRGYGATTQTIAAPLTIGVGGSKFVTILMDRATFFQCTITNGSACWSLNPGSGFVFFGPVTTPTNTGGLGVSNSANVSNVIKALVSGTVRPVLDNVLIVGNGLATVTDSVVNLQNVLDGTTINLLTIGGYANTTLLKITNATGGVGPVNLNNLELNCQAIAGCKPVLIDSTNTVGVMGGINLFGGSITHPGTGGLAIITIQDSGGNQANEGVLISGTQFESSNTGDIGVLCSNCRGLTMIDNIFTAATSAGAACLKITGANADAVVVQNINNFNSWTNTIQNAVNGKNYTTARITSYTYNWGGGGGTTNTNVWDNATGNVFILDAVGVSNDGVGLKHKRGTAGCATAASVGAACTTTVTWTTAFPDANYTAQCGGRVVTSGVPINGGLTAQVAASVTFQTVAGTAAAAQFTNIDCVAMHDP